jgi:eukaryotic-like serine/threonine-protein kinase
MADLQARLQAVLGDAYRVEKELGGAGMSRLFLANEACCTARSSSRSCPPEFASEVSAAHFKQEVELGRGYACPALVLCT